MIFLNSRYADSTIVKAYHAYKNEYHIASFREYPYDVNAFSWYVWKENDRIDRVASIRVGSANNWWKIMDINPEILNPNDIAPGTRLRIPRV
ncbi:MAG: LysM peptidoglycan-binding domain-containing protein [Actinobacteria bacterium]|jgi:hypothetical protein|nr:LysM peptidoglycan-binding domain-containing protein [Actinomycetota bacterium]